MVITRRQLLACGGAALAAPLLGGRADPARADPARALPVGGAGLRLAAIDWAMLDTAMALGVAPVAACELRQFRKRVTAPVLPEAMIDLGLRGSPNLELLQLCHPDLILSSPFYSAMDRQLAAIAPLEVQAFYYQDKTPWAQSLAALPALASRLGLSARGEQRAQELRGQVAGAAQALSPEARRPLYLVEIGDARHVRVFGDDSLFGSVARAMGFDNAWDGPTRFSFAAPVPLEALAAQPQARIVLTAPAPTLARGALARSTLWHALPAVAAGRVHTLSGLNAYGGPLAGVDFAAKLMRRLEDL